MTTISSSALHEPREALSSFAEKPIVAPLATSTVRTRLFAGFILLALMAGFGAVGHTVYRALRDSFVAPAILSPDSDVVIANKLKISEVEVERARASAEMEGIEADLAAADHALRRLEQLSKTAAKALDWMAGATSRKASENNADVKALAEQKKVIVDMLSEQRKLVAKARVDVDAGIISRSDYARETQTLNQLQLALIENQRTALQSESSLQETMLAKQALARRSAITPELIAHQEEMIRVELEITKLESEKHAKLAQKKAVAARLAKIDELDAQLRGRPIFQAINRSLDVAFVPYTQLDGVEPGAQVYSCIWGLVWCKEVGSVAQLVPGEVILPDPWGNQARGQYAVLNLVDHDAARDKTLRIRPGSAPAAPSQPALSKR